MQVDLGNMFVHRFVFKLIRRLPRTSISAVNYGPFACTRFTTKIVTRTRWTVRCYLGAGAGTNLAFTVTSCKSGRCYQSAGSTQTVSYKPPAFKAGSLRLFGSSNKSTSLTLGTTLSTEIAFDGAAPVICRFSFILASLQARTSSRAASTQRSATGL